ncbi:MAG: hypothetical protein ABFS14_04665 [Gemmatimonadota bacterium]
MIAIEVSGLLALVAFALWRAFPLIEKNPSLMVRFKPCRGEWWEAEIRGCQNWNKNLPVEPINTYSNLAYLAAGWLAFREVGTLPAGLFALVMAYLCIGSALYHGVKTVWAAALDHSGMYAVFAALAFYAMAPLHKWIIVPMLIGSVAAAYFLRYEFQGNVSVRMGIFLSLVLVGAVFRGDTWLGIGSIVLFLVAYGIWHMGKRRIFWGRWGHGLWHLLTAAAIALMFVALPP